ncbi:hypothetical protein X975_19078, partial [Stegodyphus mimosarum]
MKSLTDLITKAVNEMPLVKLMSGGAKNQKLYLRRK